MRRKVPKKNISSDIADIEKPHRENGDAPPRRGSKEEPIKARAAAEFAAERDLDGAGIEEIQRKPEISLKKISLAAFALAVVVIGWVGVQAYARWHKIADSLRISSGQIGNVFGNAGAENGTGNSAGNPGFGFSDLKAILGNAGAVYKNFGALSETGLDLAAALDGLQNEGFDLLFGNRGAELIGRLKQIRKDLSAMSEANKALSSASLDLSRFVPGASPLSLDLQFDQAGRFLDALIGWLESADARHVLVLFGNSSELRPGGGFTGSYADVSIKNGGVTDIDMRDINEADRQLARNIVPPKPLQAIASRWRAGDANWFFGYPLSAAKTAELIEASELYRASSTKFDIVAEVSPRIVTDILALTGPISLPGPSDRLGRADKKLAIDKDNLLAEIQEDVEARQGTRNPPKEILLELEPLLLEKIRSLPAEQKRALAAKFSEWIAKKDLMLYGKDAAFEKFFEQYGAAGSVLALPANFNGDYLAVVNANIGSKTDAVLAQKILFQSQLNLDGTASDRVTITREHRGNTSSFWWYRVPNEDYLQIFTPAGASLSGFSGGWNRTVYPKINYRAAGYEIDPLVAAIESSAEKDFNYPLVATFAESGKNVFASWIKTDSGKTSAVKFDYSVRLFAPPAGGIHYQFVFEKQAASAGSYQFEIYAPAGFRWKENKLPVFEYATGDPDGRTIFNLTLEKIL